MPPTLGEAAFVYGSGFVIGKGVSGYRALRTVGKATTVAEVEAVSAFGSQAAGAEVGLESRTIQELAYLDQAPYNPHAMQSMLVSEYGAGNVTSSTLPSLSQPNVKLANKGLHLPMPTGENIRVPFDMRGFPIFDKYSIYETRLSSEVWRVRDRTTHFKAATADLESSIRAGFVNPKVFNETQLQAIMKGSAKIPGYTWHHDLSKIQLIPEVVHNHPLMRHVGGFSMGVK